MVKKRTKKNRKNRKNNRKKSRKIKGGGKKTCLLGMVGLYRTFEETSKNIYDNVIKNNPDYDFTIIINTDYKCDDLKKNNRDKRYKQIIYDKDILESKLKDIYSKFGNLKKIIYFNNNGKYKTDLFRIGIKQILDDESKKYDMYIFSRLDVILNKPIKISDFTHFNKIYTITGGTFWEQRYDHDKDWDYFILGPSTSVPIYINNYRKKCDFTQKEVIELGNINKNNGLFYRNYSNNIINFEIPEIEKWVINYWRELINLKKNLNLIYTYETEKMGIYSKILRNYDNIKNIKF